MEQGKIFKFHNDLDTDQIIASQYLLLPNLDEMKGHAFESLDPDFAKKVKSGDFVVGGGTRRLKSTRRAGRHRKILRQNLFPQRHQHRSAGDCL